MTDPAPVVVVVEDNPADVRLVEEGAGVASGALDVRVYGNGATAVETLTGPGDPTPDTIDLLLVDLNLPGTSGFEILRALRDEPSFDGVPVVVVSSSENPDDVHRAYEASANAYLTKPTDPDEFIGTIAAAVRFWIPSVRSPATHE